MLGLAEYVTASKEVERYGREIESTVKKLVESNTPKDKIVSYAHAAAASYQTQFEELIDDTMREVASNAVKHYAEQLGVEASDDLIESVVRRQYKEKYYGATLTKRLGYNFRLLEKRIDLAGQIDPKHLSTTYSSYPMFGSQTVTDTRLLLGTLAKIENDVAREMAEKTEVPFLRWTLSHKHKQTDICDDLANNVDKAIVTYLQNRNLRVSPKGLYFAKELPQPPHPNCQCEYGMVRATQEFEPGRLERAVNRVRKLLRRLTKR